MCGEDEIEEIIEGDDVYTYTQNSYGYRDPQPCGEDYDCGGGAGYCNCNCNCDINRQ